MKGEPEKFIAAHAQRRALPFLPEIELYLAARAEELWRAVAQKTGELDPPFPFWGFAWAGGVGLARFLLDRPEIIRGKRVLSFACGGGVDAIAAALAGAKDVRAVDIDPLALCAARMNAAANGVSLELLDGIDMENPPKATELIIAGDVCYEHLMSHRTLKWLRLCAAAGIQILLADPGRAYAPQEGIEELARLTVPTSRELEEKVSRDVSIGIIRP